MPTQTRPAAEPRSDGSEPLEPRNRKWLSRRSRPNLPAGPPAVINMLRYALNPYEAMGEWLRYGDCYTVRQLGQPPFVMFSAPPAIKEIFAFDPEVVHSGEALAGLLGPIVGWNSLLVLDGERWSRERRLMQPPFHGERMHTYASTISEITNDVIDSWRPGQAFSVHAQMQKITLEVIMRVVFGVEEGERLGQLRAALLRCLALSDGPAAPFVFFPLFRRDVAGLTPWGRFCRRRRAVGSILLSEIHRRRAEGTAWRTDVLSILMEARDENGQAMSDGELIDEMFTLLGAGHETTATSLAWTFYHALLGRDVMDKLREELASVVGTEPLGAEHLGKLQYLDAAINETLRLTPVVVGVVRRVKAPVRIGGRDLPAGVNVSAPIYAVHHRPDLWPDPEKFDPDRFINARPRPYTFFPFGGGMRRCLGAAFAGYEMKIVFATVLSRAHMSLAPGYRARAVLRTATIGPSKGVPVIVDSVSPRR